MVLVFIYGPAAVGKLTTAKSLSKITGYPIFHNHLSFDLVASIFKFGEVEFLKLDDKIRLIMFGSAAKKQIKGLIFTFCYSNPLDNTFIKKTINIIKKYNGRIAFVRLTCEEPILFKRVENISRKNSGKINDKKKLQKAMGKWNMSSKISFVNNLEINNTKLPPAKTASLIKKYYKLK
ncbi:MAG: AAA family ATPase [Patescibacteria group bacterium]